MVLAKDITGQKFHKWIVLNRVANDNGRRSRWRCRCECGNKSIVRGSQLTTNRTKGCRRCALLGSRSVSWKGCGDISGNFWYHVRTGATKRNLEFEISIKEAWDQFIRQEKRCALSGVSLVMRSSYKMNYLPPPTASLDRIDSSKGYLIDNIQWVHKDINMMKRIFSQDRFIELCILVAKNQNVEI